MENEGTSMCGNPAFSWDRLEDQLQKMDNLRKRSGVESTCEIFPEDGRFIGGIGGSPYEQPFTPCPAISLYDPACHSIRSQTRPRGIANKITGN